VCGSARIITPCARAGKAFRRGVIELTFGAKEARRVNFLKITRLASYIQLTID
jgi:hypothetical protein